MAVKVIGEGLAILYRPPKSSRGRHRYLPPLYQYRLPRSHTRNRAGV